MTLRRVHDEGGVVVILVALLMAALLIMLAVIVDLGYVRGSIRFEQSAADLSALAAGKGLGVNDPVTACQDTITYLDTNMAQMSRIDATDFCATAGNNVGSTTCSGGELDQAAPTQTRGRYTVAVHYPVPDAEIADRAFGAGLNDGTACDRMRVIVTVTDPSFFGGFGGSRNYRTTRSATVRAATTQVLRTPALWLLDPTGCTGLDVGGGSQVIIGTDNKPGVPGVPGVLMLDSDGSHCSNNAYTISASGAGSLIRALDGNDTGFVGLFALPPAATSCVGRACSPDDVVSGRLQPQPAPTGNRSTRAPVDWRFNCKPSYPTFPKLQTPTGIVNITGCPYTVTRSPYIDLLTSAFAGAVAPPGYQIISGGACSPSGTITYTGNTWVDCSGGFSIGNGTSVAFESGNVVFTGEVKMTGGVLEINHENERDHLPTACMPPTVTIPCIANSSENAAIVYMKKGGFNITGGQLTVDHATVLMSADSGQVKVTGGSPPRWTAPTEGPFAGLTLWTEAKDGGGEPFQITGGANMVLSGAFFTPEATVTLSGGGDVNIPQSAQFIAYRLNVSGGGVLWMSPDPETAISTPPRAGILIR